MTRIKPQSTLTEIDIARLLQERGGINAELEENNQKYEELIRQIRDEAEESNADLRRRADEIDEHIMLYLQTNADLFVKPKSRTLKLGGIDVGKIGFRREAEKLRIVDKEITLESLKSNRLSRFIQMVPKILSANLKRYLLANPQVRIDGIDLTPARNRPFSEVIRVPDPELAAK